MAECIDILDLLGHYILALAELEDVLASIDDPQCAIGQPHAHIACMMPALGVDGLGRFLWILIVTGRGKYQLAN